jgi:hypothetical protein
MNDVDLIILSPCRYRYRQMACSIPFHPSGGLKAFWWLSGATHTWCDTTVHRSSDSRASKAWQIAKWRVDIPGGVSMMVSGLADERERMGGETRAERRQRTISRLHRIQGQLAALERDIEGDQTCTNS